MPNRTRRSLERLFHPDAADLRWFFCDASALVSGLRAAPIEPSIRGTELEADRYQAADAEFRRRELVERHDRILSTVMALSAPSATVITYCFARRSQFPMVPSDAWAESRFGDLAAAVYMRSAALGAIETQPWKTNEAPRTRAMVKLCHASGDAKLRERCIDEVYAEVVNAAEEWHARKAQRAA